MNTWRLRHPLRWQNPTTFFSQDEQRAIAGTIRIAEQKTSAEIRLAIMGAASRKYWLLPALLALALSIVTFFVITRTTWDNELSFGGFVVMLATLVVGYLVFGLVFPTQSTRFRETAKATAFLAQKHHIGKTRHDTGLVIALFLVERRVVVWGDDRVRDVLDAKDFKDILAPIESSMHAYGRTECICKGILRAGNYLGSHFPIRPDDTDELPNEVIIEECL